MGGVGWFGSDIVTAQTSTNSSIATNQMDITSSHSVDNTFSYLPTNYYNIYNGCNNNIRYTTRHNLPSLHYDPGAANVYNVLLEYNDKPNGCPSNFGNNPNPGPVPMPILPTGGINEVLSNMGAKGTAYLSLLYNYYNLIDGGNTEMLLNTIELSWPENAWDLRAVLLSKSPYLSKDVLVETAMKGTLPQAMLLEVILANPDACRSEDVLEILGENIPNPFPEYLIEVVRANKDNKTLRTAMEEIISSVSKEFSDLNKLLIDYSLMDSTYNVAEARIYMLKRGGLYDYYAVAESYIDEGNMDSVWYYFYKIPEVFKMNETDIAEWDNYKDYYSCRGRLIDRNLNLMQLGSDEELTVLQTIADLETGRASALAQNILCFFYEKCKDDPSEENGENRLLSSKPLSGVKKTNMNIVKATPNPANVYVDFSWQLPILNGDAILTIADGTGKLIEQRNINNNYGHWIWDTRNVNSGVYYYDIKADKTSFGSDKLIIRK